MESTLPGPGNPPPRLLDQLRGELRTRHYSLRTEEVYVDWVRRFILFHDKRHPRDLGAAEVGAFLSHLAVEGHVSPSTVYRALAEFVDAGLLRKLEIGGRAVYEPAHGYPQHDHLYCQHCHKLFEFRNEEILAACDRVAKARGFRVTGHRILIYGVCERCATSR